MFMGAFHGKWNKKQVSDLYGIGMSFGRDNTYTHIYAKMQLDISVMKKKSRTMH